MNILKAVSARINKLFGLDVKSTLRPGFGAIESHVMNADGKVMFHVVDDSSDPYGDYRVMSRAVMYNDMAKRGEHFKPTRIGSLVIQPHIEGFGSGLPSTDEQIHILHLAYWPLWDFDVFKFHTHKFEQWYVKNCFDLANSPLGSRDCMLQRQAWFASIEENKQ